MGRRAEGEARDHDLSPDRVPPRPRQALGVHLLRRLPAELRPQEGARALEALGRHCSMVKELGRYREAVKPVEIGA